MKRIFFQFQTRLALFVVICWALTRPSSGLACSGLAADADGPRLLAGNYDWRARGGIAFISPRNQIKSTEGMLPNHGGKSFTWVSKFGSVTLSQFGRDFPMQGINEAGLAGMVFSGEAQYPAKGAVGQVTENFWLQYQLDNYSTIENVVTHIDDLGINKLSASLHWFLCDGSGECATVEFLLGKPVIHRGDTLSVRGFTNTSYDRAMSSYHKWLVTRTPDPRGYDSTARFIRLAEWSDKKSAEGILSAINQVSLGGFTAWQTIFDMGHLSFKTRLDSGFWMDVDLETLSFDCGIDSAKIMSLSTGLWVAYNHDLVAELFARGSEGTTGLGIEDRKRILSVTEKMNCKL